MRTRLLMLGLSLALFASAPAAAGIVTIADLYNTGVDNSHNGLASGATDGHYTLTGPGSTTHAVVYNYGPPWKSNLTGPDAKWIAPNDPTVNGTINGVFSYKTTFTVGNDANLSTALITGQFAADDIIRDILLNGASVGVVAGGLPTGYPSYNKYINFSIAANFAHGNNTLEFITVNTKNVVTGLLVQMSGSYSTAVPEPSSAILAGLGAGAGLGLAAFRRRKKAAA